MISYKKIFFVLIVLNILSCDKPDNFDHVSLNYPYKGSFSFVIGNSNLNLINNGQNLPNDWILFPDRLASKDSIEISTYFYFNMDEITINKKDTIINFIEFKLRGNNEFPVSAFIKCYLADSLKNTIYDEEICNIEVNSATLNDSTVVFAPTFYIIKSFYLDEIKKWKQARYFYISIILNNQDKKINSYKYFKDLNILVGLGIRVDFNFNLKDVQ